MALRQSKKAFSRGQGCIFRSHLELTKDHVLTSAYVKILRTVTRNAVNKSVWRKKDYSWLPLNKHAMNIWLNSLRIRAHLSWRTGKHLHVLHVLRTYSTCSYPGYQDTTTYAALYMDRGHVFEETPKQYSGQIYKCEASIQFLSSCCVLKLCYRISIHASREVYDASWSQL